MIVIHTKRVAVINRANISQQLYNVLCGEYLSHSDINGNQQHIFSISEMYPEFDEYPANLRNEMSKLVEACDECDASHVMFE